MKATFKNGLEMTTTEHPDSCSFVTFEKENKSYTIDTKSMTSEDETNQTFKDFLSKFQVPLIHSEIYGNEHQLDFGNISIHFGDSGDYVRVVENGEDEEILSYYWTSQEFSDDPENVLGVLIGAICSEIDGERYLSTVVSNNE